MFPNISKQSQDLFKNCLGLPGQLSQNPGLYCRLEVKLGENYFNFQTEKPGNFLAKGKVLANTGETREEGNLLERECLLLETMK